jgi:nucleotide-binding universal stress UspA family protein
MYTHILIATDGSELAHKAEMTGLSLAKALGAKVTIVTVTEPWDPLSMAALAERGKPNPITVFEEQSAAAANRVLAGAKENATKLGVTCATVHARDRHPAEGIIEAAEKQNCDLIVIASHGRRGLSKIFLGSQAAKVVTLSALPVLVCR